MKAIFELPENLIDVQVAHVNPADEVVGFEAENLLNSYPTSVCKSATTATWQVKIEALHQSGVVASGGTANLHTLQYLYVGYASPGNATFSVRPIDYLGADTGSWIYPTIERVRKDFNIYHSFIDLSETAGRGATVKFAFASDPTVAFLRLGISRHPNNANYIQDYGNYFESLDPEKGLKQSIIDEGSYKKLNDYSMYRSKGPIKRKFTGMVTSELLDNGESEFIARHYVSGKMPVPCKIMADTYENLLFGSLSISSTARAIDSKVSFSIEEIAYMEN